MKIILQPAPGSTMAMVRYYQGVLTCNGNPIKLSNIVTIPYGEEAGCATFSDDPAQTFDIIPSTWINPNPPAIVAPDPMEKVMQWRNDAYADSWQIVAVLGKVRWTVITEWAKTQNFTTQILIEKAVAIPRQSEMVDAMAWLLGMTDAEVDEVFKAAVNMVA